ncbi:hypothetical protein LSAT2_021600, partial [Lamellibrachia satsuma]
SEANRVTGSRQKLGQSRHCRCFFHFVVIRQRPVPYPDDTRGIHWWMTSHRHGSSS